MGRAHARGEGRGDEARGVGHQWPPGHAAAGTRPLSVGQPTIGQVQQVGISTTV